MNIMAHINQAWSNLIASKLRSLLAVLGILVGTAAVVALVTSTRLSTDYVLSRFKSLGTNLISVSIMSGMTGMSSGNEPHLTLSDVNKLHSVSSQIIQVAPFSQVPGQVSSDKVKLNHPFVIGVTDGFFSILKIEPAAGRLVSLLDTVSPYCVLGSKVANKIQATGVNPLGTQIRIDNTLFTVVGIAKPWKKNALFVANVDDAVMLSLPAAMLFSSHNSIDQLIVRLVPDPKMDQVRNAIKAHLQKLLPKQEIYLYDPEQIIKEIGAARHTNDVLLTSIGAISLLVGAIGVMNIMLVSVIERRREIGIRLAIGAKQRDILKMFLIEAIVLTLFGGILGVVLGVGISAILASAYHWGFKLYLLPPILGFTVSVLVGVVSGFYPALRASRLDPIEIFQS